MAEAQPGRPTDRLVGGYLLVAAIPLLLPGRPDGWPFLLLVHLGLAALLLPGTLERYRLHEPEGSAPPTGQAPQRGRTWTAALADWYPLLLMPFLYWELPFLGATVWDGRFFDGIILGWEQALFGGQPSATLALRWDSLVLSEILHLAYLAYFPLLFVVPAALFFEGRPDAFRRSVFALMIGFLAHYVVFLAFPVQGPRYLFPAPGGPPASGALYGITHTVLEAGSSRGAAFPSAHVAVAVIQTGNAIRFLPGAAPLVGLATLGIAVGAVYGGFHYAADVLAGAASGALIALLAPAAWRQLRR
ncbi:MAG: hypothetical protein GWM90_10155 [Gemmatimonadetes bacterium]|nr:hypothetical protein [Gemmatimonadota bacterium]NIQ54306.1 hypothetical protein [Gemmatimonadota bacterium]NIU74516.1 hypothetical protein [Gammaproteobacteria bacterium]NIX44466.1 hypothetical protein [Gemmatimonadota bacterium]NIY08688.1 hypothetical protein [Gemmatimonadota bacterium]